MKTEPHNPDYKLVSVTINDRELVYGETNEGNNQGLEIYYCKPGADHFYHSRRFRYERLPMIYIELYWNLKGMIEFTPAGHKSTLTGEDYKAIAYAKLG